MVKNWLIQRGRNQKLLSPCIINATPARGQAGWADEKKHTFRDTGPYCTFQWFSPISRCPLVVPYETINRRSRVRLGNKRLFLRLREESCEAWTKSWAQNPAVLHNSKVRDGRREIKVDNRCLKLTEYLGESTIYWVNRSARRVRLVTHDIESTIVIR